MLYEKLRLNRSPKLALQLTLTHRQLLFLRDLAVKKRVTVSWILRALLRQHLTRYLTRLPARPPKFVEPTTKFNLVFHRLADKNFYCSLVHNQNRPVSAVLRQMVVDLQNGEIDVAPGLKDAKEYQSWKSETGEVKKESKRYVIQHHTTCWAVKKLDYWPQNPHGYQNLMKLG